MKNLVLILGTVAVLGVMLVSGCRPPELEGVVINMNQGLYDKAYVLAQDAVVKYPNNPEAWYLLGELHARNGKFADMNESFKKSQEISPQFASQIEQMRMKYFAENYNSALKNFYNPAREEQDPEKRKQLYSQAAEKFLASYEAMPSRMEPLAPMSVSFLETGDTASAEKYVMKAIEKNPKNDTLLVQSGDFYYKIDKMEKARSMYQKALEVNRGNADAHLALGEIYTKNEDWDMALEHWNKAMNLQPNNPAIPNNIAIVFYNNEKYEDAIPYIKKTLELEPVNENAYELLSLSYMQAAQKYQDKFNETEKPEFKAQADQIFDNALPFLKDATTRFPENSLLWNNLGVCFAQKGMKEDAAAAFEKQKELEENQE